MRGWRELGPKGEAQRTSSREGPCVCASEMGLFVCWHQPTEVGVTGMGPEGSDLSFWKASAPHQDSSSSSLERPQGSSPILLGKESQGTLLHASPCAPWPSG